MSLFRTRGLTILNKTFRLWLSASQRTKFTHTPILFTHLRKNQRYLNRMAEGKSTFKFSDYDCIGFDLDNTLSHYKIGNMIEMEYEVMSKFLVEKKGYSKKHLYQPFDHGFILRGLIIDDENGNILRVARDGYILQACHGTRFLSNEELVGFYPERHWKVVDVFIEDPLTTWNGPYSEKMRTLLDYFDIASSLLFARAVDAVDEVKGLREKYSVWLDIQDALQDMFDRNNFQSGTGGYFLNMKNNPEKFYHKCSDKLLSWLLKLRQMNKKLFLLTGSHVDFASHTATNTLGPNWRDYFDIVVCFAKKPGFFTMRRDFLQLNGNQEGSIINDLQIGGIYSQGNWTDLHKFLVKETQKPDAKFLYIGDNLIQDIYTPHIHAHCDTVTVCEELEAEGVYGFERIHPDQDILVSNIWGSYFEYNEIKTCWNYIMQKHSKLCVPSLDYVANLPVDHVFPGNKIC